jgi:hypothetical protein
MPISDDIRIFLVNNRCVQAINFFASGPTRSYSIQPLDYRHVADAIRDGHIQVRTKTTIPAGASAQYDFVFDAIELLPNFSLYAPVTNTAYIVHECTHAILDMKTIGDFSNWENEAVAFLAEAIYLEACQQPPLSSDSMRQVSQRIAQGVLGGSRTVSRSEFSNLISAVRSHPLYAAPRTITSNSFNRSPLVGAIRYLTTP